MKIFILAPANKGAREDVPGANRKAARLSSLTSQS